LNEKPPPLLTTTAINFVLVWGEEKGLHIYSFQEEERGLNIYYVSLLLHTTQKETTRNDMISLLLYYYLSFLPDWHLSHPLHYIPLHYTTLHALYDVTKLLLPFVFIIMNLY